MWQNVAYSKMSQLNVLDLFLHAVMHTIVRQYTEEAEELSQREQF